MLLAAFSCLAMNCDPAPDICLSMLLGTAETSEAPEPI